MSIERRLLEWLNICVLSISFYFYLSICLTPSSRPFPFPSLPVSRRIGWEGREGRGGDRRYERKGREDEGLGIDVEGEVNWAVGSIGSYWAVNVCDLCPRLPLSHAATAASTVTTAHTSRTTMQVLWWKHSRLYPSTTTPCHDELNRTHPA